MKIIDAYWEKKNLGVTTSEIIVEDSDKLSELEDALCELDSEYQVVKIPVNLFSHYILMGQHGFIFAEAMVSLVRGMQKVHIPDKKKEINKKLHLEKMDDKSFEKMLEAVSNGLYHTDRVSVDPYFNKQQSSNRYFNWLTQERSIGNEFYKLMYGNDYVGYLDLKQEDKYIWKDVMTGIFPEYRGKGFAMGFTSKLIEMLRNRNATKVYGDISTNNTASLQSRMRYGYKVDKFSYVFVKHGGVKRYRQIRLHLYGRSAA